jgi:general secretion pathway protein C
LSNWVERLRTISGHRATVFFVNAMLVAVMAYSLAQWTWRMWQPAAEVSVAGSALQASGFDAGPLLSFNPFGSTGAATPLRLSETLPRTSLNLVLTGVIMRGGTSYALISVDGAPELPFGVGESLLPGAVLEAVEPERAIILRGGAREAVVLKDLSASLPADAIARGPAPPSGVADPRRTGPNRFAVDRDAVRQQVQRPEFLGQALIVPHAGGGFQVREVQAGSLYEKLGLRAGDVIRNVNGQPVNNMDEAMRMYQQLGSMGQINIEVVRAGRPEILHYDMR